MKIVIFSDVHGNLPAFESILKHAGPCDGYICLGDLVNYGPWGNECVDLALSLPSCTYIMGNHEEAFINGFYAGSNELVKTFFTICYQDFKRVKEIEKFKDKYTSFDYCFTHTINNSYVYPDTDVTLDGNYVIGHSHHQFKYINNNYTLFNAGSVGQNRKKIDLANYLVLDTSNMEFKMCEVLYNIDVLIDEMKRKNYPLDCIQYYLGKLI